MVTLGACHDKSIHSSIVQGSKRAKADFKPILPLPPTPYAKYFVTSFTLFPKMIKGFLAVYWLYCPDFEMPFSFFNRI